MSKCIMSKNDICNGYDLGRCAGNKENCKFKKTKEEQRSIERKIVRRLETEGGYLYRPFISLVTGAEILPAGYVDVNE